MKEYFAYVSKFTDIHKNINESLNFIHWIELIKSDSTVFIKPNFTYPFYKEGITTNPLFLKEILAIIKESCRADHYGRI